LTHFARLARLPLAAVLLALVSAPAHAADTKPLVWAADEEGGLPYVALNKDEERVGFEVDLAAALARELNRAIEFKQYDFKNLVPGLLKGDFDFAMNGLEMTPERKDKVRFTKAYYVYRQQLVVRKDEDRIGTFKDCTKLKSVVVGTLDGTAAERLLDQYGVEKKLYDGQREAYEDLGTAGRIDAVLMDLPIALTYARHDKKLKFTGQPFAKGYYGIAFRPEDRELADEVDAALDRLKQNGTLRAIYIKWGLWNEAQEELMPGFDFEEDAKTGVNTGLVQEASLHWSPAQYLRLLGQYALLTVALTAVSFALAMALGLPIALARLYGPWWLWGLATGYIEFFRGVPVMLLLFFLYFGLPAIAQYYGLGFSLGLSSFWAATLGLGLNYAAYEAEIYRAGVQAIPAGQWEAAASLGMSAPLTFRRIILPQALRSILPPTTGDLVALFKDTSIASAIGLVELNKEYLILSKSSLQYVEIGLATAALYLLMSVPLGYLSRRLEQRWGAHAA
jgi:polar amino acid transport system substrate-binding protein